MGEESDNQPIWLDVGGRELLSEEELAELEDSIRRHPASFALKQVIEPPEEADN